MQEVGNCSDAILPTEFLDEAPLVPTFALSRNVPHTGAYPLISFFSFW